MGCGAVLGLLPAIIFGIILFLIHPILGVLWVSWIIGYVIYVFKFKKHDK